MNRIVAFAHRTKLNINLAYYPPYHSKYNPVERTFGWLEKHWNGSLLDSVKTVLKFAKTLTFNGKQPLVSFVEEVYQTGVKLNEKEMAKVEKQIERLPKLKKWFVSITGNPN
jgi:Rhodopirellula transposase DDE domain